MTTETTPDFSGKKACVSAHRNQYNKHKQLRIDTTVSVGYTRPHTHGLGIWKNPRVPMTIRVDKELKKAFKETSKALFGSTCNPLECIMAAFVGVYKTQVLNGVYPELTVNFGEVLIQRDIRERRKLTRTHTEIETVETETELQVCGYRDCKGAVVGKGVFQNKREFLLCVDHLKESQANRQNWSNIEVF